ncbi:MAG: hypothetical protein GWP06_14700, partial [Actinobacteria bacterium]|nr:hypothetical protein [Actinomycetota bacterium]
MRQVDEELLKRFQSARTDISALDSDGDRDTIVKIGAALEEMVSDIPEDMPELIELFNLCLEGLQAIYQKDSAADFSRFTAAAANAMVVAQHCLMDSPVAKALIDEAGRALWDALGREPEECPYKNGSDASHLDENNLQKPSLDDIAVLLIQLEPTDISGLARIAESLKDIAKQKSTVDSVGEIVDRASCVIDSIVQGKASDPARAITKAGMLIDKAQDAMEEPELMASTPDEAAEAKQIASVADETEETEHIVSTSDKTEKNKAEIASEKTLEEESSAPSSEPAEEIAKADVLPADADQDLLTDYVAECRELIEGAEAALLSLEANSEDVESVNTVFRAFHTVKGTSAFLGLNTISKFAHSAESLLSRVRDGEICLSGVYADLSLRSADMLRELVKSVEDALGGKPMVKPDGYDELIRLLANPQVSNVSAPTPDIKAGKPGESDEEESHSQQQRDTKFVEEETEEKEMEKAAADVEQQPIDAEKKPAPAAAARMTQTQRRQRTDTQKIESSVRVRTGRLDHLIDMVGELVIAQSMVVQDSTVVSGEFYDLQKKVVHAGKIVRDLQDLTMSMRMVPLKATFQKMTRLVRDLARKSGKKVNLITVGEDTEIDRNMVDVLNDPLVHMVRNAVDHGIELPEVREKNGKPGEGTVQLTAFHSGGSVVVEIKDDGKGLNRKKIAEKAISKGLIESSQNMTDNEVFNFIFEAGFSTAEKITDVSGRGVGLDVVRKGIEALRGRIEISSKPGKGCTFTMRMPLTMAITDAMLVKVGSERYLVPTMSIQTCFRPDEVALFTIAGR